MTIGAWPDPAARSAALSASLRLVPGVLAAAAITTTLAAPAQAAPGDMDIATFLTKSEALKRRGVFALGSRDIAVLRGEVTAAGQAYRARIRADRDAGRPPHSCPPERANLNAEDFLAHLRGYPAATRPRVTVRAAFADLMARRYPCR